MSADCDLCGLPATDDPVADADVDGSYCCRGCLEVARATAEAGLDRNAVRERVRSRGVAGATDDGGAVGGPTAGEPDSAAPEDDLAELFLDVEGMHCTTCEAFLALRGDSIDGVASVEANYATETARRRVGPGRPRRQRRKSATPIRVNRSVQTTGKAISGG